MEKTGSGRKEAQTSGGLRREEEEHQKSKVRGELGGRVNGLGVGERVR